MEEGVSAVVNSPRVFEFFFTALAALGACAAAIFTLIAARATAKANTGQTLLACLDKYITIMRHKSKAAKSRNPRLIKDFYRELFDLHWSEFHLWHEGAIPNHVMKAWMSVRLRNFKKDFIVFTSEDDIENKISYADMWNHLKSTKYFENDDPFVTFMDTIHSGNIGDIKQIKKNTTIRKK